MKTNVCYLFIFDGYSDWEPALVTANLRTHFNYTIKTVGLTTKPIHSMGSLCITPELAISDVKASDADVLIIPGGTMWEQTKNNDLRQLVQQFLDASKLVATICGATIFMADNGFLNNIPHTSNGLEYLKNYASNYKGEAFYQQQPVVTAGNIITANGAAMIAFADAIYEHLQTADKEMLEKISALYKSGGMDYRF